MSSNGRSKFAVVAIVVLALTIERGVIDVANNGKQLCDMNMQACEQRCMTSEGNICLQPFYDIYSQFEVKTCTTNPDDEFVCTTVGGRDGQEDIYTSRDGVCMPDACQFMLECSSSQVYSVKEGQFSSSGTSTAKYASPYETRNCLWEFESTGNHYSLTFHMISIWCIAGDHLLLKFNYQGEEYSYRLCGETKTTVNDHITFCVPSTNVVVETQLTDGNYGGTIRSGFNADFAQIPVGTCQLEEPVDTACGYYDPLNPNEGTMILTNNTIKSLMYPLPYPLFINCLWKIQAANNKIIKITPVSIDLGSSSLDNLPIEDNFIFSQESQEDQICNTNTVHTTSGYEPFISSGIYAELRFTSGEYFNWHTTFILEVTFETVETQMDLLVDRGYCVSTESFQVCEFPFTYQGTVYHNCTTVDDDRYWCYTLTSEKVYCNMSLKTCLPDMPQFTSWNLAYTAHTSTNISWTTDYDVWDHFLVFLDDNLISGHVREYSYQITSLQPDTFYAVKVQLVSFGRPGPHFNLYFSTTAARVSTQPTFEPGEAIITWDETAIPKDAEQYTIQYTPSENDIIHSIAPSESSPKTNSSETTEITVSNLIPGVVYDFHINDIVFPFALTPNPFSPEETGLQVSESNNILFATGELTVNNIAEEIKFTTNVNGIYATSVCNVLNSCINAQTGHYNITLLEEVSPGEKVLVTFTSSSLKMSAEPVNWNYMTSPAAVDVTSLQAHVTQHTIDLQWSSITDGEQYRVTVEQCTTCQCENKMILSTETVQVSYVNMTELIAGTTYHVEIVTIVGGNESKPLLFYLDTRPDVPERLRVITEDRNMFIDWHPPRDGVWSSFIISWSVSTSQVEEGNITATNGNMNRTEIIPENPGKLYKVEVRALSCNSEVNRRLPSDPASILQISFPDAPDPNLITFQNIQSYSAQLKYNINAEPIPQSITVRIDSISFNKTQVTGEPDYERFLLNNLMFNTTYTVDVFISIYHDSSYISELYSEKTEVNFTTADMPEFSGVQNNGMENLVSKFKVIFTNLPFGLDPQIENYTLVTYAITSESVILSSDNDLLSALAPYSVHEFRPYPPALTNDQMWSFIFGENDNCETDSSGVTVDYCNEPVQPSTSYTVRVLGQLVTGEFKLSDPLGPFTTEIGPLSVQETGSVTVVPYLKSVVISFPNRQRPQTIYNATIKAYETDKVIDSELASCSMAECNIRFINLKLSTRYQVVIETSVFNVVSMDLTQLDFTTNSLPVINITTVEVTRTSISLQINQPPFADDVDVLRFSIVLGEVGQSIPDMPPYHTWQEVYSHETSQEGYSVYQVSAPFEYPPNRLTPGITLLDEGKWGFVMGRDETCRLTPGAFCNGKLVKNGEYNLWFVAFMEDDMFTVSGPFGPFKTAVKSDSKKQFASMDKTTSVATFSIIGFIFVLFVILLLVMTVIIGRRMCVKAAKKERESRYRQSTMVMGDLMNTMDVAPENVEIENEAPDPSMNEHEATVPVTNQPQPEPARSNLRESKKKKTRKSKQPRPAEEMVSGDMVPDDGYYDDAADPGPAACVANQGYVADADPTQIEFTPT